MALGPCLCPCLDHDQYYQALVCLWHQALRSLWHDLVPISCLVMSLDLEHLPMKDTMYIQGKNKYLRQMDKVLINAAKKISQTVPLGVHWWLDLLGSGCGSGLGCLSGCLSSCWSPPLGLQPFGLPPLPPPFPPFDLSLFGRIVTLTINMNNRTIMYMNANNCYLFFLHASQNMITSLIIIMNVDTVAQILLVHLKCKIQMVIHITV